MGRLDVMVAALLAGCGVSVVGVEPEGTDAGAGIPIADSAPPATEAGTFARPDARADGSSIVDSGEVDADATLSGVVCTEAGAVRWGGHCYFLVGPSDHATVKEACIAANAHLVKIDDEAEQKAIAGMGDGDRWIGLFAVTSNNDRANYHWQDGTSATYENWKPSNPDENGRCVVMDRSDQDQWVDRQCTELNPRGICERE